MSARETSAVLAHSPALEPGFGRARPLRVLTLTPFYPSTKDPSHGGFVAEPLIPMQQFGITSQVIAAQPFYRRRAHSLKSETSSAWKPYVSLPGNLGLPTGG